MDTAARETDNPYFPTSPQIIFKGDFGDQETQHNHVSLSTTDAFSLTTFEELIEDHSQLTIDGSPEERRCLIIARVRTWDPSTGRYFDSYYNAWHLNKILFRAQTSSSRSYIHRISVTDPMTNAEIVKVEYFKTGNSSLSRGVKAQKSIHGAPKTSTTIDAGQSATNILSKVTPANSHRLESGGDSQTVPSSIFVYYIGNDIDYMTSKALRRCFHKNAITEEDAQLFLLQAHGRGGALAESDWARFLAGNNDRQSSIPCSPVDTLLQAVGVLFCCVLYYVQIEDDEYGLEQQGLIDETEPTAETTAHEYWQPVSAVQDLTLTYST